MTLHGWCLARANVATRQQEPWGGGVPQAELGAVVVIA